MARVGVSAEGRVIVFSATDGVRLNGMIFGNARSGRCIVFLHGMMSSSVTGLSLAFARREGNDYGFFTFNNRGHDAVSSFSKYVGGRRRRLLAGTTLERFEDCVHDIRGAIDALHRMGYNEFVLCGHSTGCQKAAYYKYKTGDRRVKAVVLLAPCDDHNLAKARLGKGYTRLARYCRKMIGSGKGGSIAPDALRFSAQRLDSLLNTRRAEARMFDYEGRLREFGSIKVPTLAVFGEEEENATRPVSECLRILDSRSGSRRFGALLIGNANHSFEGREDEVVAGVESWLGS